jgi:hypothetical protein
MFAFAKQSTGRRRTAGTQWDSIRHHSHRAHHDDIPPWSVQGTESDLCRKHKRALSVPSVLPGICRGHDEIGSPVHPLKHLWWIQSNVRSMKKHPGLFCTRRVSSAGVGWQSWHNSKPGTQDHLNKMYSEKVDLFFSFANTKHLFFLIKVDLLMLSLYFS